MSVNTKPVR